jgi:hypothetical protein
MPTPNNDSVNGGEEQVEQPGKEMTRRDAVQLLASLPVAAFLSWPTAEQEKARSFVANALRAAAEGTAYAPKFFTAAEYRTVRILADMILPKAQSQSRFGKAFADATQSQREAVLNDIAWPDRAPQTMSAGVTFFNRFRDLTSSGFWSSEMGVKDLKYMGNVFAPNWNGCPPEALKKLGVTYAKFDRSKLRLTP